MLKSIPLPEVRRIEYDNGSHIEPALDPKWTEAEKLAWKAAVVAADTGLAIRLDSGAGDDRDDMYGIGVGRSSTAAYDFLDAWTLLTGISAGARAVGELRGGESRA